MRPPPDEPHSDTVHRFLWGLLLIPVIFGFRLCQKTQDDPVVKEEMLLRVADFPNYAEKEAYYRKLVERHHPAAFRWAYYLGNKSDPNLFVECKYFAMISSLMMQDAEQDGEEEVYRLLAGFNEEMNEQVRTRW